MRHLLTLFDLNPAELTHLLQLAEEKKQTLAVPQRPALAAGYVLALLFEKPSLRTRVSFEAAMAHLGGSTIYLGQEAGWGERESVRDFVQVLTSYADAVVYRGKSHETLEEFRKHAHCPIINGLTDLAHPCQAIADLLTLQELHGDLSQLKLVFVGDGNNVARSLALGCAMVGTHFVLAAPADYQFDGNFLQQIKERYPDARLDQTVDPHSAVTGAHAVYTDVWASMGQEADSERRRADFAAFQVNANLMSAAGPQASFLHCLPARRGEEVTNAVIDSPQSQVVRQAENRLHAQKAILLWLFDRSGQSERSLAER